MKSEIMKRTIVSILITIILTSCIERKNKEIPVEEPAKILKSLLSFLEYNRDHLRLSEDFEALDTGSVRISKENFLGELSLGNYLPLRLISDDTARYQLIN